MDNNLTYQLSKHARLLEEYAAHLRDTKTGLARYYEQLLVTVAPGTHEILFETYHESPVYYRDEDYRDREVTGICLQPYGDGLTVRALIPGGYISFAYLPLDVQVDIAQRVSACFPHHKS
jgi:hypothetical protein